MKTYAFVSIVIGLSIVFLSTGAQAVTIPLSTHANDDDGHPADPAVFDAILNFSVMDNTLTLAVTNLTPENVDDPALKINEIYFNATGNVQNLVLSDVIGANANQWALSFLEDGFRVGSFGQFDVSLVDGQGNQAHVIGPRETITFVIDITGSSPFSGYNFTTEFTDISAGGDKEEPVASLAAAKFYDGDQPGVSGYGATNVPEPATICLLGLGALALLRKRRV